MGLIKNRSYRKEGAQHTEHGFTISMGNDKMGFVPSFSVTPGATCDRTAPCWLNGSKEGHCYADSMQKRYPSVRKSWANNLKALRADECNDTGYLVSDVTEFIGKWKPELFRWHVGGDVYDTWYLEQICKIADNCPDTRFWIFTKQFGVIASYLGEIPENLHVILSVWPPHVPSVELMKRFGCCYFQDKEGTYIVPDDAFECQGDCEMCTKCSELNAGDSVVIIKH